MKAQAGSGAGPVGGFLIPVLYILETGSKRHSWNFQPSFSLLSCSEPDQVAFRGRTASQTSLSLRNVKWQQSVLTKKKRRRTSGSGEEVA